MICNKCGKEIKDGAKFCTFCGAVQEEKAAAPAQASASAPTPAPTPAPAPAPAQWTPASVQNPPAKTNEPIFKKWWFWLAIVAVVALVCVTIMVSSSSDKDDIPDKTLPAAETTEAIEAVVTTVPSNSANGEHDDAYDDFDDGYNYDDDNDYDVTYLKLDQTVQAEGMLEITLEKAYWSDELIPQAITDPDTYYWSDAEDIAGEKYFVIEATLSNLSSYDLDMSNMYLEATFNETYKYVDTCNVCFEKKGENSITDYYTLTPMSDIKAYFVCSVPDKMYESANNCSYVFGFDKEFSYEAEWDGLEACDYIYCAQFTIED